MLGPASETFCSPPCVRRTGGKGGPIRACPKTRGRLGVLVLSLSRSPFARPKRRQGPEVGALGLHCT